MERVLERGSPLRLAVPALCHQAVYRIRADDGGGLRHPVPALDVFDHFSVVHTCEGERAARRGVKNGDEDGRQYVFLVRFDSIGNQQSVAYASGKQRMKQATVR